MRIYAIGDLHLPGGPRAKRMDRFGDAWVDHASRIRERWLALGPTERDVLLLVGDLSWAMTIEEARDDLAFIEALPGRKVLLRGNHDYWWASAGKVRRAVGPDVTVLQASHVILDGVAIVGTRGWQCPGSSGSADVMVERPSAEEGGFDYTEHDGKIYRREVARLELGLQALRRSGRPYERLVVALHYPPMNPEHEPSGFTELLDAWGADVCVHGHLHGASIATAFEGVRGRTRYHCVSADAVRMEPRLILQGTPQG